MTPALKASSRLLPYIFLRHHQDGQGVFIKGESAN
jgi:hypothetical protein